MSFEFGTYPNNTTIDYPYKISNINNKIIGKSLEKLGIGINALVFIYYN